MNVIIYFPTDSKHIKSSVYEQCKCSFESETKETLYELWQDSLP